jgi:hypothetical protein
MSLIGAVVKKKLQGDSLVFRGVFAEPVGMEHIVVVRHLVAQALPNLGNDRRQIHQTPHGMPFRHQREKKLAGRVGHHHRVVPTCRNRLGNHIGIPSRTALRLVG